MTTAPALVAMVTAALEYRQRGLSVIPVGADKHPLIEWSLYQTELPHPDELDAWWDRWPAANVAVVTGAISGLVVLDADGPDGLASLKALETPATTWLSKTGRLEGGWQQFFAHPGSRVRIGNRAALRPGLDVRGDGGYVILPPSLHASGRRYQWLTPPGAIALAPLPAHVLELLLAPPIVAGAPPNGDETAIPEGRRNDALYRLTRSLLRRGVSVAAALAAVLEENRTRCHPPLGEHEVREIVEHATTQPHRPPATGDTPTSEDLGLISIGELLGEPDEAHTWIVAHRLPASGLGLLAGKPKGGKSTLARCLAFAVARGSRWLGHATTRGPVIYLALEEKRSEVRDHFRGLGATAEDPIFVLCASAPVDGLEQLRRAAERLRPVLIIIDPLFRFVRVDDGNDYATMTAALEPLMALARESGAHVLAVHHLGKLGGREDGDSILGSTAIFAAVDTALILKRSERYRTLASIQRYGEDLEEILVTLDPETRNVSAGGTRTAAEVADAERLILAYLASVPGPVTEAEFDGVIECRRQLWKRGLRALVARNQITRTGRGGKADPFRYCGSLILPGNQGTGSLFPDLTSSLVSKHSGSRVPHGVEVPAAAAPRAEL